MRTNVTIDESLVSELQKLSGAKTKTAAVTQAVREQIRRVKLRRLAAMLGSIDIDAEAIRLGNEADLKRAAWLEGMHRGRRR
jgi:hypothetical protein